MAKSITTFTLAILILAASPLAMAGEKQQKTREAIDTVMEETLQKLFKEKESAKELYDKSYGYAVFSNMKVAILLTSARGKGAAIHKESGKKTYMKMGSLGVNVGYGIQKMQVVFLFQNKKVFDNFGNKGWQADAAVDAALIKKGVTLDVEFRNGIAVYQFTDKGLMLQANISGTKYWKSKKLNKGV